MVNITFAYAAQNSPDVEPTSIKILNIPQIKEILKNSFTIDPLNTNNLEYSFAFDIRYNAEEFDRFIDALESLSSLLSSSDVCEEMHKEADEIYRRLKTKSPFNDPQYLGNY